MNLTMNLPVNLLMLYLNIIFSWVFVVVNDIPHLKFYLASHFFDPPPLL